jgi:hypothetical protein
MIALISLLALVAYVTVAIFALKAIKTRKSKVIVAAILILIPFGDVIAGRTYFHYLCVNEGGQKIYKSVELEGKYFLSPGEIDLNTAGHLLAKGGELNHQKLKERFSVMTESQTVSSLFRIEKDTRIIKESQTSEILGTETHLFYFGGWLVNSTGLHVSGDICPQNTDQYYRHFYEGIFKPIQSNRGAK